EAGLFFQSIGAGEEGSGMAVGTESEQNEVEAGKFVGAQFEESSQLLLVISGRGDRVGHLRLYTKDVAGGNWNLSKQRFFHHAVVAFGMVGWNVAFVAEK